MSTDNNKYNRSVWSLVHCGGEGERRIMDRGRLTEVYKALKVEKIKIDYSLNAVDAITFKHQTTYLK